MTIKLWSTASGKLLRTLKGHTNNVVSVAFSPDGLTLASGSSDHTVKLWDAGKRTVVVQPPNGHYNAVESVAFSPNGHSLASASWDATIKLWDLASVQGSAPATNALCLLLRSAAPGSQAPGCE